MKALIMTLRLFGAIVTGTALYGISYEVERMEDELAALQDQILREREATHALEAEWAYLARPSRIEELAGRYLPEMKRLSAERIGVARDLPYEPLPDLLDILPPETLATPTANRIVE